jgi:hypothetical protein
MLVWLLAFAILLFAIGTLLGKRAAAWIVMGVFTTTVLGLITVVTARHIREITPLVLSLFAVAVGFGAPIVIARRIRRSGIKHKWRFRAGVVFYLYGLLMAASNPGQAVRSEAAAWAAITVVLGPLMVASAFLVNATRSPARNLLSTLRRRALNLAARRRPLGRPAMSLSPDMRHFMLEGREYLFVGATGESVRIEGELAAETIRHGERTAGTKGL